MEWSDKKNKTFKTHCETSYDKPEEHTLNITVLTYQDITFDFLFDRPIFPDLLSPPMQNPLKGKGVIPSYQVANAIFTFKLLIWAIAITSLEWTVKPRSSDFTKNGTFDSPKKHWTEGMRKEMQILKATARVHLVHMMKWNGAKQLPTLGPGQTTRVTSPPVGCQKPHPPSSFIIITQPESWHPFIIPQRVEGWVDRYCSKGVQPVPKLVYRSGFYEKNMQLPTEGFKPWSSHTAVRHVTATLDHCDLQSYSGGLQQS